MNQRELSIWLKALLAVSGILGLFLCFGLAPNVGLNLAKMDPSRKYMFWPCLIFIWIACIPIYMALYQAWMIFTNVGEDNSFCEDNMLRLKKISRLSIVVVMMYSLAAFGLLFMNLVSIYIFLAIFVILFASIFVAVSSAVLSHLVNKAVELKNENDLTI
ncbi:MAG: DUF2975 domain-containing protein [Peptostreptococcaceae bacterium]|nr:DUF2975 domain-containing protein [Peptostreptococcaceae bacterium]